jgi:magnesium chelatase family protein
MAAVAAATWREPPYRSPHHSTPARALIGGGQPVRPGEISLAHHGILFLDELPEFSRDSLESLREPLETGEISIARVRERLRLPAKVMLVAAMNPCPCGYFGAPNARRLCNCPPDRIMRYRMRISGPLLDRFDMVITLEALPPSTLLEPKETANLNLELANQVAQAREIQKNRQQELNAKALIQKLDPHLELDLRSQTLLQKTAEKFGWSARAWNRVLRVARTVADLESTPSISVQHLSEAIEMRRALQL